jgi:hypothetical protein
MALKQLDFFFLRLLVATVFTATVLTPAVGLAAGAEPALSDAARTGNWETVDP